MSILSVPCHARPDYPLEGGRDPAEGQVGKRWEEEERMVAQAYQDGYFSALDGVTREENPYAGEVAAEHHQSWDDGWDDAQDVFYVSER